MFAPRSLTIRVVAFSTVWAIITLIMIYTLIASLYRESSERAFESLLSAHLFNLIGSVGVTPGGNLTGAPDLGDLRFSEPRSGWYWAVEPMSKTLHGELRSLSMTGPVPSPGIAQAPFNSSFQRSYEAKGLDGEELTVIENEFVLDAQNNIGRFRVMGNRTELEHEMQVFQWRLFTYLSVFGVGMIAINAVVILLGLRPLQLVQEALAKVREGTAQRLRGVFPAEIQPLANETNTLIENNRRIVERSRTQVGNLAHSLKTPLAVLINEAHALGGEKGKLIAEQASAMQNQLEHYLQRARIAAQRGSVVYRTPVAPVLERLVRVMTKVSTGATFSFTAPSREVLFAGEREDLEEMIGNLLENAMKWAKSQVLVTLTLPQEGSSGQSMCSVTIEDDGPGIPEDNAREAMKRGRRLDESKPGTGLGLSIVAELASEYGGSITLGQSSLGGLKAIVLLRCVE